MKIALLSETEAKSMLSSHPFEAVAAQELLGKSPMARKLRGLQNYGCRFCLAASKARDTNSGNEPNKGLSEPETQHGGAEEAGTGTTGPNPNEGEKDVVSHYKRAYTFNGMRSHLKAA
jgi:hypothetical protein